MAKLPRSTVRGLWHPGLGLIRELLLQVADALNEEGEASKCLVSLSARGYTTSPTPCLFLRWARRCVRPTSELLRYRAPTIPDGMSEIRVCKANRGCSTVTTGSGSNDDVTFRTINAFCKKRIRSCLRS